MWELSRERQTNSLSQEVENNFYKRCAPDQRPVGLHPPSSDSGSEATPRSSSNTVKEEEDIDEKPRSPDLGKEAEDTVEGDAAEKSSQDKDSARKPKYDASLWRALHTTFFWKFWIGGLLKLFSGTYILRYDQAHYLNVLHQIRSRLLRRLSTRCC